MTSIDTWSPWVAIIVTGGWGLLAAAGLGFSLYLSHRHLDAIKEALKNSRYIYIWGPSLGNRGWIWSIFEISKITGMIMMPKAYIRLGDLDPVDSTNFPSHLKRLLKIKALMLIGSAVWLVAVSVLLEFK